MLEIVGAGEGNRTLVISLEGFCSTIELHPRRRTTGRKNSASRQSGKGTSDYAAWLTDDSVTSRSSRNSRGRGDSSRTKRPSNRGIDNRCRNGWNNKAAS